MAEAPKFKSALQEAEHLAQSQRETARNELAIEWGNELEPTLRAIDSHIQAMQPDRREALNAVNDKGVHRLLDAGELKKLGAEARQPPAALAELAKKDYGGDQRRALEHMMKDRRGPYWRGPDAERHQAAYRDLVRAEEAETKVVEAHYADAKNAKARDDAMAWLRTESSKVGFDEAAFVQQEIGKLIAKGVSPARARATANYFRKRLRSSR